MKEKEGDKCKICFYILRKVEIPCEGAQKRGEPNPTILACRCLYPGDYFCNCGNPCRSFF